MKEFNDFVSETANVFASYFNEDLVIAANHSDKIAITKDGDLTYVKIKYIDLPSKVSDALVECTKNCAHRLSATAMLHKVFKYKYFDIRINTLIENDKVSYFCWCSFSK